MPMPESLLREERFYSPLDPVIGEINKQTVRLDEQATKRLVRTAMGLVKVLIDQLKRENDVFRSFYNRLSYVGSFYDGLRVKEATEFDLNLILKLPCIYDKIKIENSDVTGGFVKVNVKDAQDPKIDSHPGAKEWKRWVDADGYLLHDRVLSWWESVLTKVSDVGKHRLEYDGVVYEVQRRKNGPANTLHITEEYFEIDIDLVPVIEFPTSLKPPKPIRWGSLPAEFQGHSWVVVPKPMDDKRLWRLSFPEQEKEIMLNQLHLKYINKLMKRFRDANKLQISSYYIKTFFIWEAYEKRKSCDKYFWQKPPSYLFVYMLVKLAEALEKKELIFFWHENMNLFKTLNEKLLENMGGQVRRILMKITKLIELKQTQELDEYILQLFGTQRSVRNAADMNVAVMPADPTPVLNNNQCCVL